MSEEEDIRDVMKEERSRGRRPIDAAEVRKNQRLREDVRKVILSGDERALIKILHEAGLQEDSREFQNALNVFREVIGRRETR